MTPKRRSIWKNKLRQHAHAYFNRRYPGATSAWRGFQTNKLADVQLGRMVRGGQR